MKTILLVVAAIAQSLLFSMTAYAGIYNQCEAAGDDASGIYFEDGFRRPSPNASKHPFQDLVVVLKGELIRFQIGGDGLYYPDYRREPDAVVKLNFSNTSYIALNARYVGNDGKSHIEIKFDTQSPTDPGVVRGKLSDGRTFELALDCGKPISCGSRLSLAH